MDKFITISVKCSPELSELLIAELFSIGFESFQELEDGFDGSCNQEAFSNESLKKVIEGHPEVRYTTKEDEKVNWNEEWEKNYDPIAIENKCLVRATFHDSDPSFEHEIVINPKMSFGTGHHATTYQMISYQLGLAHQNKKVLDVGTGTGILAIMAVKLGASKAIATDIDDWCIENSSENLALNNVDNVELIKGQIEEVKDDSFDIVIANINKNVLLEQLNQYVQRMAERGTLLLSGFYTKDDNDLVDAAQKTGLKLISQTARDNWSMLAFNKQ